MTDANKDLSQIHIIDPNAASEAQKYENPVASREALLLVLEEIGRPASYEEVCVVLKETDPDRVEAVRRRLIAMSRDGQLISNRRDQFVPIQKTDLIIGNVQGHADGYGFVLRDGADDVFLSTRQMSKVFHGDRVAVRIVGYDRRGRPEGRIEKILERNTQQLVGRYYDHGDVGLVQPDSKRITQEIIIPPAGRKKAVHGQYVVVQITQQPQAGGLAMGEVVEVLGDHMAPGMEIDVAIRSHNIPHEWSKELVAEAKKIPDEVKEADKKARVDLRALPFVTIDGEDAKDFDDAVYCERNKSTGGWRLFVAIADVSHYVQPHSYLDKEAHVRGNSLYFPEFVVPMLPEKLSNGLCSLNPEVDRLVMVCEITISKAGNISSYQFMEGVIHSHARLTYNKVWSMLDPVSEQHVPLREHYQAIVPHVDVLYGLFKQLRIRREARGAMDFDSVETRIIFDSERKIQKIIPTERNEAHMLIEECMLAANVCAADILERYKVPTLYRVHAGPGEEKLRNLHSFLGEMGLSIGSGKDSPTPKDYQLLLESIATRPDSHLIQTVLLRSLSQAVYEPENDGHFGLAYKAYTHFTSPIRRYPDLLVHRAIKSLIHSERDIKQVLRVEGARSEDAKKLYPYDTAAMVHLGEHCSMTERRADDATRDVIDFLKCEYISNRIGEDFEGTIAAVTGFGLFVELKEVYVEGLVHVSSLGDDYYQFDAVKHRLVGERSRRSFRLGDSIWVKVVGANLEERKIDFELTAAPANRDRQPLNTLAPVRLPRKRDKQGDSLEVLKPSFEQPGKAPKGKKAAAPKKATAKKAAAPKKASSAQKVAAPKSKRQKS
ncbi:MAG: ribonuclease [Pseudomonadota bacterium]